MHPISLLDKRKILPPHMPHKEGIRMEHIPEIPIDMLTDDPVQDHSLIMEELERMMELPY
jgi:hypothetical protein